MRNPPEDYHPLDVCVLSNFDHRIDRSLEQQLRGEKVVMEYAGHNFHGEVWWDQQFHCAVSRHGSHRETVSRPTLEEIRDYCCTEYGPE